MRKITGYVIWSLRHSRLLHCPPGEDGHLCVGRIATVYPTRKAAMAAVQADGRWHRKRGWRAEPKAYQLHAVAAPFPHEESP